MARASMRLAITCSAYPGWPEFNRERHSLYTAGLVDEAVPADLLDTARQFATTNCMAVLEAIVSRRPRAAGPGEASEVGCRRDIGLSARGTRETG